MQSAFAYPQSYEQKPYLPWSGVCFGAEAAAGVAAPVHPQQQHAEQGLHSSSGMIHPITPQAGAVDVFNTFWQVAPGASFGEFGAVEDEQQTPEHAPPPKQRKGANKAKKGSARRDLDKLAKQEQRMIKNRESAARSRLRRQQHTADLEQENEALRSQVADLTAQVEQLKQQVAELDWNLQLSRVPNNMPRTSGTASRTQQTAGGISQLPAPPSLSLSLPNASSLLLPPVGLGPLGTHQEPALEGDAAVAQDGLGMEGFDFTYMSRRASSYA